MSPDLPSPPPLLALCVPGDRRDDGLAGLVLEAGAPLDAARPCRIPPLPFGQDPGPVAGSSLTGLAALLGLSREPTLLAVDPDGPSLLARITNRESPLPVRELARPFRSCRASSEPLPPRGAVPAPLPDAARSSPLSDLEGEKAAVLRLSAIARMTSVTATDPCDAFILGLLSLSAESRRSERQGLTLLWLDSERVLAALVFRDTLFALAELGFPALFGRGAKQGAASLVRLLNDFRLGWLPREEAARFDGSVWRGGELPCDAEGFKPLFASGPTAAALAGRAKIMPDAPEHVLCRGLLYGSRLARAT